MLFVVRVLPFVVKVVGHVLPALCCLLMIRNPNRRQSNSAADDVLHLNLLTTGEVLSTNGGKRSLAGSYQVTGPGLPVKAGTWIFLDAAVLLVVGER